MLRRSLIVGLLAVIGCDPFGSGGPPEANIVLSDNAAEIADLRGQITELNQKLESLEAENTTLRDDLTKLEERFEDEVGMPRPLTEADGPDEVEGLKNPFTKPKGRPAGTAKAKKKKKRDLKDPFAKPDTPAPKPKRKRKSVDRTKDLDDPFGG